LAELNIVDVISNHRRGSHTVILQIPFEFNGKKYEAISVGPFTLDHRMLWRDGTYKMPFDMMCAVCHDPIDHKVIDPLALRQLCNPDDERIETTFVAMMPSEIRNDFLKGIWPGASSGGSGIAPTGSLFDTVGRSTPPREESYPDDEYTPQEDRGLDING
jgi:hypothetical protein